MALERLRKFLQPPVATYHPLADREGEAGRFSPKNWHGYHVAKATDLKEARDGLKEQTGGELRDRLREQYGRYVEQKVAGSIAPGKKLDQRKVVALEKKAHNLLHDLQKTNKRHLQHWIRDTSDAGLVAEQFELITGYRWGTVSAHERVHMVDQVRTFLAKQPEKLSRDSASYFAGEYLQHHETLFARSCANTAEVLKDISGMEEPILVEHLREWVDSQAAGPASGFTRSDQQMVINFQYLANKTQTLVTSSGVEDSEAVSFRDQLAAVKQQALMLVRSMNELRKHQLQLPEELRTAMLADMQEQLQEVHDYGRQLSINSLEDPRNQEQWQEVKLVEAVAARGALDDEISKLYGASLSRNLSHKEESRLERCEIMKRQLEELEQLILTGTDNNGMPTVAEPENKTIKLIPFTNAKSYSKAMLHWVSSSGISKKQLKKGIGEARKEALSNNNWPLIQKQIAVRINGKSYSCVSEITPATHLNLDILEKDSQDAPVDVFQVHYGGKGRPSAKRDEATHAVNLCETRAATEQGEQYRGLRSATLCAYGVKDPANRAVASRNRARELVVAALRMELERDVEVLEDALHGTPVELKLLSTSLLSPDKFRHITHIHDDEHDMHLEQGRALQEIQAEIAEKGYLDMVDCSGEVVQIPVKLDLLMANFGVNNISLAPIQQKVLGAWGAYEAETKATLDGLLGSVETGAPIGGWAGEYLNGFADDKDKEIVVQLIEQIRHLYVTEGYRTEGEDAYKMVERIQLLGYKLGAITHFNCKSGKDRTGEADASVKRLAAQIDVLGYVPDPDTPLSREEQILRQIFLLDSGNIELQRMNLNQPGYKTQTGQSHYGDEIFRMSHHPEFNGDDGGGDYEVY